MENYLKEKIKSLLRKYGKRITNVYSPAKPFNEGIIFLKKYITNPEWIIDIGSANGTPDLISAFPLGEYKYLLIEANPFFYPDLDALKTKYTDSLLIEKCFCGEDDTYTSFNVSPSSYKSSRYATSGEKMTVEVKRLDTILEQHSIQGPVFLKVDVEGAEFDVLSGATKALQVSDVVILECWINVNETNRDKDLAAVISLMKKHSFVVFDFFGGHNYRSGLLKHLDIVFVKEDSPYRKIYKA